MFSGGTGRAARRAFACVVMPPGLLIAQSGPYQHQVQSATSVDGLTWTRDAGAQITDPFVVRWQGGWKMYFKTGAAATNTSSPFSNVAVALQSSTDLTAWRTESFRNQPDGESSMNITAPAAGERLFLRIRSP